MGKPAARMGDSTAHGGTIVVGAPTVLIGGKPAARVSDMHTCPMQTPAPVPVPHVGGPVLPPGGLTVLICGLPAACVGDMCVCVGPPDSILPPGEPTVLIGGGGGGALFGGGFGGGGAGGAGVAENAGGDASGEAAEATSDGDADGGEDSQNHFLDVRFTDKGGFPITGIAYTVARAGTEVAAGPLTGRVRLTSLESGDYDIELKAVHAAKWSAEKAAVGDKITLSAATSGIERGTAARLIVYVRDFNSPDRPYREFDAEVGDDKIEVEWEFAVDREFLEIQEDKERRGGYSMPVYYFTVEAGGARARSGLLRYSDVLEIRLHDHEGEALPNRSYRVVFPNGEVREGTLDDDGYAKEEDVPPGKATISFGMRG